MRKSEERNHSEQLWFKWPIYCKLFGCYIFFCLTSVTCAMTNMEDIWKQEENVTNDDGQVIIENGLCQLFNETGEWCYFQHMEAFEASWSMILYLIGMIGMILILKNPRKHLDRRIMRENNKFRVKMLAAMTVGILANNANTIWAAASSETFGVFNPAILKWLTIFTQIIEMIYSVTLLLLIGFASREVLRENLYTRLMLAQNLGTIVSKQS